MAAPLAAAFGRLLTGLASRAVASRAGASAAGAVGKKGASEAVQQSTKLGQFVNSKRGTKMGDILGLKGKPFDESKIKFPKSLNQTYNMPGAGREEVQKYNEFIQDKKELFLQKKRQYHEQRLQREAEETAKSLSQLGKSALKAVLVGVPFTGYKMGTARLASQGELAPLNARIARALAASQIQTLHLNVAKGKATSASFESKTEAWMQLEKQLSRLNALAENFYNYGSQGVATSLGSILAPITGPLNAIADYLGLMPVEEMNKIQTRQLGDDILKGKFVDPNHVPTQPKIF